MRKLYDHIFVKEGNNMFTLEEINEEVMKFNKYLSCNFPDITSFVYSDTQRYYGEVNKE